MKAVIFSFAFISVLQGKNFVKFLFKVRLGAVFRQAESLNDQKDVTEDIFKREIPQKDLMRFFINYFDGSSPSYGFI